jgi:hypothetical protein
MNRSLHRNRKAAAAAYRIYFPSPRGEECLLTSDTSNLTGLGWSGWELASGAAAPAAVFVDDIILETENRRLAMWYGDATMSVNAKTARKVVGRGERGVYKRRELLSIITTCCCQLIETLVTVDCSSQRSGCVS